VHFGAPRMRTLTRSRRYGDRIKDIKAEQVAWFRARMEQERAEVDARRPPVYATVGLPAASAEGRDFLIPIPQVQQPRRGRRAGWNLGNPNYFAEFDDLAQAHKTRLDRLARQVPTMPEGPQMIHRRRLGENADGSNQCRHNHGRSWPLG
jgi:hypothetical protein